MVKHKNTRDSETKSNESTMASFFTYTVKLMGSVLSAIFQKEVFFKSSMNKQDCIKSST